MRAHLVFKNLSLIRRGLSTTSLASNAPPVANQVTKPVVQVKKGSSFLQRLASFSAGFGIGCGIAGPSIYSEITESNEKFSLQIRSIYDRLDRLEKK